MNLLILPHQLFNIKYFPKDIDIKKVIIHEHPQYFTKYNFNKKVNSSSSLYEKI